MMNLNLLSWKNKLKILFSESKVCCYLESVTSLKRLCHVTLCMFVKHGWMRVRRSHRMLEAWRWAGHGRTRVWRHEGTIIWGESEELVCGGHCGRGDGGGHGRVFCELTQWWHPVWRLIESVLIMTNVAWRHDGRVDHGEVALCRNNTRLTPTQLHLNKWPMPPKLDLWITFSPDFIT